MKILHISTSDIIGGAAKACYNISFALNSIGIESKVLVQHKLSSNDSVSLIKRNLFFRAKTKIRLIIDYVLIKIFSLKERGRFTIPFVGTNIQNHPLVKRADIINLHWVNGGFLSLKSLEKLIGLNKPIVWTFHDMWVFTGGCHYTLGCIKYTTECRNCPSLRFNGRNDISNIIFHRKKELFDDNKFLILTCSNWLAKETRKSKLLTDYDIATVPNPIDTQVFKPEKTDEAREALKLPKDKIIILFSAYTASEVRKGISYLSEVLISLNALKPKLLEVIEVIILGSLNGSEFDNIPYRVIYPGRIEKVEEIVQYYSSADLFIAPSIQENLSNTVMESLACGTPVLAFNIGGMPDMIDHLKNGYLADDINSDKLLDGLLWFLDLDKDKRAELSVNSRSKVLSNFTLSTVAKHYAEYYKKLIDSK